jgi:hypothetical protein
VVGGGAILGIIIVRQTGHKRFAGRGGSAPGARGFVEGAKVPGRNFLHLWHHHSNFAISPLLQRHAADQFDAQPSRPWRHGISAATLQASTCSY